MIISQGVLKKSGSSFLLGIEIVQFGPRKAAKIGFKVVKLNSEVIVIKGFSNKGRPLQTKFPL